MPFAYVGPRTRLRAPASSSSVQIDSPVSALMATTLAPAWKYSTPSTTSGVTSPTSTPAGTTNDHRSASWATFAVFTSSSGE